VQAVEANTIPVATADAPSNKWGKFKSPALNRAAFLWNFEEIFKLLDLRERSNPARNGLMIESVRDSGTTFQTGLIHISRWRLPDSNNSL
jgi:hypothetical protein